MRSVNIVEKFRQFDDHWSPKIVGELNDCYVKLVKVKGEFVWHHHDVEDELFLVVKGRLLIKFRAPARRFGGDPRAAARAEVHSQYGERPQ